MFRNAALAVALNVACLAWPAAGAESNQPLGVPSVSPEVLRACRVVARRVDVRVHGDFGQLQGRVRSADPSGLDGLWRQEGTSAPLSARLTWNEIDSVETLGNSAAKGARTTGLMLGGIGLLIGLVVSATPAESGAADRILAPVVLGTVSGMTFGAAIGAIVGSGIPRWQKVYERR